MFLIDPKDHIETFAPNTARGGGYFFGKQATSYFLQNNKLNLLIRSHEVVQEGFKVHHDGRCVTVFSAPHYFNANKGAIIRISGETEEVRPTVIQFSGIGRDYRQMFGNYL